MNFHDYLKTINKAALAPSNVPHYKELKACWDAATKAAHKAAGKHTPLTPQAGKRSLTSASDDALNETTSAPKPR